MAFRDFLMNAPSMFMVLGERIGVISHIVSFWQYRFPTAMDLIASTEEVVDILQDFHSNLEAFDAASLASPVSRRRRPPPVQSLEGGAPYVSSEILVEGASEETGL